MQYVRSFLKVTSVALAALLITGCASGPTIRSDYDRSANFASYRTFGFPKQTERASTEKRTSSLLSPKLPRIHVHVGSAERYTAITSVNSSPIESEVIVISWWEERRIGQHSSVKSDGLDERRAAGSCPDPRSVERHNAVDLAFTVHLGEGRREMSAKAETGYVDGLVAEQPGALQILVVLLKSCKLGECETGARHLGARCSVPGPVAVLVSVSELCGAN